MSVADVVTRKSLLRNRLRLRGVDDPFLRSVAPFGSDEDQMFDGMNSPRPNRILIRNEPKVLGPPADIPI